MAQDGLQRSQNLILESRKRLSVSGVEEVIGFDDNYVQMMTALGRLTVHGESLHVENLSVETGDLLLTGQIAELIYEDAPDRAGLWKRLFG